MGAEFIFSFLSESSLQSMGYIHVDAKHYAEHQPMTLIGWKGGR